MIVRIEVSTRSGLADARGDEAVRALHLAGFDGVSAVQVRDVFWLRGPKASAMAPRVARECLADPVCESVSIDPARVALNAAVVEVSSLPGVTDRTAGTLLSAVRQLGISETEVDAIATGRRFEVSGDVARAELVRAACTVLCNPVVERFEVDGPVAPSFVDAAPLPPGVEVVPVRGQSDAELAAMAKGRQLALAAAELSALRDLFAREGRDPTDAELETFAQTWSEHCAHKTFKAHISYEEHGETYEIDGLFQTFIQPTADPEARPWLRSVFVDNAGVVGLTDSWDLAFKVETHNHPSAIEPFGGANTGTGGVIRDILGVSARPIACTDVLCFGPPDLPEEHVPQGSLHPRRVARGVVAGIGDYGNKMGLPTVSGAVVYDPGYIGNPLVFAGCVGLVPRDARPRRPEVGDRVVVLGGHTGRDGVRGATFSSMDLEEQSAAQAGTVVQIGHPIHEKQVLEVVVRARDERLYHAITDCGAGGLSSAVGEMGESLGVDVSLDAVPTKYAGLASWELWLSESQERMVMAVPAASLARLRALCAEHQVPIADMGVFTGEQRLVVRHGDVTLVDLSMADLHDGCPRPHLRASWSAPSHPVPDLAAIGGDPSADLLALLATPTIRSKEHIVRTFDHEVLGGTVVRPCVGVEQAGPSDATVLRPMELATEDGQDTYRGFALSLGINPRYGRIDPYAMAWAAVDEAVRNAVCVGADPDQVALLDNFCWGNPRLPDRLGALVRCARGVYDAAVAFGAPYISGKDSLFNEYTESSGTRRAIPGTVLISALALVPDVRRTVTMDAKHPGSTLYLVGETREELGGSAWLGLRDLWGNTAPSPVSVAMNTARALHGAIADGLVSAAHDLSEGGLAVAAAEMALAGGVGIDVHLDRVPVDGASMRDAAVLFSESSSRYLIEVPSTCAPAFEAKLRGVPCAAVGQVTASRTLSVYGRSGERCIGLGLDALSQAFRGHVGES